MLAQGDTRGGDKSGMREYNARMILNVIRQHGNLSKADITRLSGLSAQTISVIVNKLVKSELLSEKPKVRGNIGQPFTPITLNPDGAYSIGLKIGRRSLEIVLMNFVGTVLRQSRYAYDHPVKADVMTEVATALDYVLSALTPAQRQRTVGMGVAFPHDLPSWTRELGLGQHELDEWKDFDLRAALADLSGLEVQLYNDATAACAAELYLGEPSELDTMLYLYVGSFVGGGVVLDGRLYEGRTGVAGALGSMPLARPADGENAGPPEQLIHGASLLFLERALSAAGLNTQEEIRSGFPGEEAGRIFAEWRDRACRSLAFAIVSASSVIDFEWAVIDGALAPSITESMVEDIARHIQDYNLAGLRIPKVRAGTVGRDARMLGGAILPIYWNFSPDRELLVKFRTAEAAG